MSRPILVTGAAGFLGYHMAHHLAADPETEVICVDDFSRGPDDAAYRKLTAQDNVTGIALDLCDPAALAALPEQVGTIYHFAARNGTQNFYTRPYDVLRAATLPTLNLIDRYGAHGHGGRLVYAGSSEVYASTVTRFGWPVPTAEDVPATIADPFNPRWSYAAGKLHGEIAVIHGCGTHAMPFTILRYHNVYGPRMGDAHVIPDFLSRARRGEFALYGAEDTRAFLYVDDAVRGTRMAAESAATAGELLHIGARDEISMKALAETIMTLGGFEGEITCHPGPEGSVARRAPDTTKLGRLTGFQERWSLRDGLLATMEDLLRV
jgi:nucleoside-diphosphate-sugar epimerase